MFDIESELQEKNDKVDAFFEAQKSHLDLDSDMLKGDIGLADYVLESVPFDTLVLNMIDQDNGLKKEGNLLFSANTDIKAWRRGLVVMVGPAVRNYKPGDIIIFPGVKGLSTGTLHIRENGTIVKIKDGHFLSESRVFGKVTKLDK